MIPMTTIETLTDENRQKETDQQRMDREASTVRLSESEQAQAEYRRLRAAGKMPRSYGSPPSEQDDDF